VNINLVTGLGMAVISAVFLIWAFTRPLGEELASQESGRRPGDDRPGAGGGDDPGRE
jgi:hypothetical protein